MTFLPTDGVSVASIVRRQPVDAAMQAAAIALVSVVWLSGAIFGLYIVAVFFGAVLSGAPEQWNRALAGLYAARAQLGNVGIGAHFAAGAVLLLLGPLQLIRPVRETFPTLHRWVGRAYVAAAFISGVGGLAFIVGRGTIGGWPMDAGFGLYGALVVVASVATFWHAVRREIPAHRAWAIRLFALVIGSWLYRMDYGFWKLLAHGAGHTPAFDGTFDLVMTVFFYVPNLIVAELFIRARHFRATPLAKSAATLGLSLAALFVAAGTWVFTAYHWGPPIVALLR